MRSRIRQDLKRIIDDRTFGLENFVYSPRLVPRHLCTGPCPCLSEAPNRKQVHRTATFVAAFCGFYLTALPAYFHWLLQPCFSQSDFALPQSFAGKYCAKPFIASCAFRCRPDNYATLFPFTCSPFTQPGEVMQNYPAPVGWYLRDSAQMPRKAAVLASPPPNAAKCGELLLVTAAFYSRKQGLIIFRSAGKRRGRKYGANGNSRLCRELFRPESAQTAGNDPALPHGIVCSFLPKYALSDFEHEDLQKEPASRPTAMGLHGICGCHKLQT